MHEQGRPILLGTPTVEVSEELSRYLRLEKIPRFEDGWQPVLHALRRGQFFVTTGEVLIPEFTVNGQSSGESATVVRGRKAEVRLDLRWTFPLAYAEIITGDGNAITRFYSTRGEPKKFFRATKLTAP